MRELLFFCLFLCQVAWGDQGFHYQVKAPHEFMVLNDGPAAFAKRIEMIERARESIDFEYFMYNRDETARILTHALLKKHAEGVKIRMLIDKSPFLFFNDYDATELLKAGIEVKYYNRKSILRVKSYQFRNHKKVLIIDGKEALLGGRNLGDEYFFNYKNYNYNDRDAWFAGPIVENVRETFNYFWNHKVSEDAEKKVRPMASLRRLGPALRKKYFQQLRIYKKHTKEAKAFMTEDEKILERREHIMETGLKQLESYPTFLCNDIEYASDGPGGSGNARYMGELIYEKMTNVTHDLEIESPYFVTRDRERELYSIILAKGVDVKLFTNSIRSSDNILIVNNFNHRIDFFTQKGMDVSIHYGNPVNKPWEILKEHALKNPWGTHAKTVVFDKKDTLIGSYNLDPRSFLYSAENAIICNNSPEIAEYVIADIEHRKNTAGVDLDQNGNPIGHDDLMLGVGFYKRFKHVAVTFFASLFDFLL
ncbi:MAG: hypothetical protein EP319_04295 [Deltaproteobacteria bacterium]|nr:MAG: hypothetical protein EP319_04295 [Deltaproteobacteria bacterium]